MKVTRIIQAVVVLLLASYGTDAVAAERYLVPVYARGLEGATGTWYSKVVVTNPQRTPVNFFVSDVYPVTTTACPNCSTEYVLNPGDSRALWPPVGDDRTLTFGSFVIESDKPIVVESTIYQFLRGVGILSQKIETIRELIPAGLTAWLPDVDMDPFGRTNLFFINPNQFYVTATYSTSFGTHEVELSPRSTTVVNFPYPQCGNSLCPPGLGLLPLGTRFSVSADGDFYALASVIWSSGDAVFKGAVIPVD